MRWTCGPLELSCNFWIIKVPSDLFGLPLQERHKKIVGAGHPLSVDKV
jgi:hypothetical protein